LILVGTDVKEAGMGMAETLGEAHDLGWKVRCAAHSETAAGMKSTRECTHSAYLDLPTLLWTRGGNSRSASLGAG